MCSVNDVDASGSGLMERKSSNTEWSSVCQKCSCAKPVIQILQIKHAYCRNCFLLHVNHKFRSTLGKSKKMRPSDVVLAMCSGSNKSLSLLHLLQAGLSEKSHKRFLFKVQVLYIDEGAVLGIPVVEREHNLNAVGSIVSSLGFSMYFSTLSSVYTSHGPWCYSWNQNSSLILNDEAEKNLNNLFHNVHTLTAKEDLLRQLRKTLMINAASDTGCGKIFTAETSTDLASKILTDVSLGRGANLHHDVSFCDDRLVSIQLMRPMRELSSKEVAFYTVYQKLFGISIPSLCTKQIVNKDSIHRLSEHFVMNLTEEFPSTVSTIFRTGEKLGSGTPSGSNGIESKNDCVLCLATKDSDRSDCSSSKATSFSRLISSLGPVGFDNMSLQPSVEEKEGSHQHSIRVVSHSAAEKDCHPSFTLWNRTEQLLCYGCRLILYEMTPTEFLPHFVSKAVHEGACFEEMEKSIQDFLL